MKEILRSHYIAHHTITALNDGAEGEEDSSLARYHHAALNDGLERA